MSKNKSIPVAAWIKYMVNRNGRPAKRELKKSKVIIVYRNQPAPESNTTPPASPVNTEKKNRNITSLQQLSIFN